MRSEKEMLDLILNTAEEDDKIRAVILNGSRTNVKVKKDIFQDYDIVYAVTDVKSFTNDHSWVNHFGERIIMQMPDESPYPKDEPREAFAYLMLFTDGNRIDLTLLPVDQAEHATNDSFTKILLDKDGLYPQIPEASERDYYVVKPTEAEFHGCCNEFWWVSTYVAKGLWRKELLYAKGMLEVPVRSALNQMIDWNLGAKHDYKISTGKLGRRYKDLLDEESWVTLLKTYPKADVDEIWNALFVMGKLFHDMAKSTAKMLGFTYNMEEEKKVLAYLKHINHLPEGANEIF